MQLVYLIRWFYQLVVLAAPSQRVDLGAADVHPELVFGTYELDAEEVPTGHGDLRYPVDVRVVFMAHFKQHALLDAIV